MLEARKVVIACATVIEELLPLLPPGVGYRVLDFGLHSNPNRLREILQHAVDEASDKADVIVLGYGLCSSGVIGVSATRSTLIIPRVDDCIAIFLGSRAAHRAQLDAEPGTYYLTKGWIDAGYSPFGEYQRMAARCGCERAERLIRLMFENYTRLALINTGQYEMERCRAYARHTAEHLGLRYEEIDGSTALVRKLVNGPWDDDFIVVKPGHTIDYDDFWSNGTESRAAARTSLDG